jgi:UDP-N-acetylmuramyl pentapeptide synthase
MMATTMLALRSLQLASKAKVGVLGSMVGLGSGAPGMVNHMTCRNLAVIGVDRLITVGNLSNIKGAKKKVRTLLWIDVTINDILTECYYSVEDGEEVLAPAEENCVVLAIKRVLLRRVLSRVVRPRSTNCIPRLAFITQSTI